MRIIIKPLGAIVLTATLTGMSLLALRSTLNRATARPTPQSSVVAVTLPASKDYSNIYADTVSSGWRQAGWAKVIKLDEKQERYQGTSSIRMTYDRYEGCKFVHEAFDTSPYDRIAFRVKGVGSGGQVLNLSGTRKSTGETKQGATLEPLSAGDWMTAVVPLSEMGMDMVPDMDSFWIKDEGGPTSTVYIDTIRLLKRGEPSPGGRRLQLSNPQLTSKLETVK